MNMNYPMQTVYWKGALQSCIFNEDDMRQSLLHLKKEMYVIRYKDKIGIVENHSSKMEGEERLPLVGYLPPISLQELGEQSFCQCYGCKYAYYAGAMANAISSEEMVIALGKAGFMASFGAAGLSPQRVDAAIQCIKTALPQGAYLFNLINSPNEPAIEQRIVDLYLQQNIRAIEASAYLGLSLPLVQYRVAGLVRKADGSVAIQNHVIAKVSRKEVARHFLQPAPAELLQQLLSVGKITSEQAAFAEQVPMADDITVEADSGGHTDNRPLVLVLPAIIALRDEIQAQRGYQQPVRIGAAGGIATPTATYVALLMGAAYLVTGSVNQACVESGTSEHVKKLLAQAEMTDIAMAPAADMFEMGVKVQVLKRGTMFAMRALKLYDLYTRYTSLDSIPSEELEKIEKQIFKRSIDDVWQETQQFFGKRDVSQIERAKQDARQKMALVFRWYLGLSSHWAVKEEKGREMDYQIWCGPSMGAFNDWTHGTYLAEAQNRHVTDVALHLLTGAAYLQRLRMLSDVGVSIPSTYRPLNPLSLWKDERTI